MKTFIRHSILLPVMTLAATTLTGCLDEAFPEDGSFTEDQVAGANKAALAGAMTSYFTTGGDNSWDIGYLTFMTWRDAMTADLPVNDASWDYYNYYNLQVSLGNTYNSGLWWDRSYYHISYANRTLAITDEDTKSEDAYYRGYAFLLRGAMYFDLARTFEYKHTDVEALDRSADERGVWGLTVPIITEKTTEAESRRTPRAPFYEMYRFIYNDLNNAQKYMADFHSTPSKDNPSLGVVYGEAARFWLELGSRFTIYPGDLQKQLDSDSNSDLSHLPTLGITTANDCFRNAAEYARKAINEGFTPTTQSEWYNKSTGFNTPIDSWMWAIIISPENWMAKNCTWKGWVSYHCPEAKYGMSESTEYAAYRMIDARLFGDIDQNDWRRNTWIDPEFAEMEDSDEKKDLFSSKYSAVTTYNYDEFCEFNAYAGFKFRPGSGNGTTPSIGNAVSIPLMRVEEMFLIEAEALAYCNGAAAGKAALETFMNTYRMNEGTTYTTKATHLEDVINEIWTQKRIELWGEGLLWYDYKRRELPIERGYNGTNHPVTYRYNSYPEAVAPWCNMYIVDRVRDLNQMVKLNPDPTRAITTLWTE
ncbi:MAG: RagB/SusD family nutrient uptake outer membrane protein [Clostridiales bacterium]|nr:RagB/SusD family nutrient uptake outer membrane protein [Clostridiales bacterium]